MAGECSVVDSTYSLALTANSLGQVGQTLASTSVPKSDFILAGIKIKLRGRNYERKKLSLQ